MEIKDIEGILKNQKDKANKIKTNDIPHLEEELSQAKSQLQELEINIKYLGDFIKLYKALKERGLI